MMDREEIKQKSGDLKCLANEHRLAIILFLKSRGSASVGEIADQVKVSFKATSKHLLYLQKKKVLVGNYDGPFVMYSLSIDMPALIKNIISLP